jgi:hypothetical protein
MMKKSKQIRVLILLLALVPLTWLAFVEADHRPDWQETMSVVIYPHDASREQTLGAWLDALDIEHYRDIETYMAMQAARYDLPLAQPFSLVLGQPLSRSPPPPPANGSSWQRLRWAAALRWWHLRFDRQGLDPDIVIVARYHGFNGPANLHSIGMPRPRLALVNLIAHPELDDYNQLKIAHELLHTVGASDLYHPRSGLPDYPAGYAHATQHPLYPQDEAELMAMKIPQAPDQARSALNLAETTIGTLTAREIGWLQP